MLNADGAEWVAFDSCPVVRVQAPLALAFVVPTGVVPSNILTVLPASAAPASVCTNVKKIGRHAS
jgi:hypothetical protein